MLGSQTEREIREQPSVLSRNCDDYFNSLKGSLGGNSFEMALLVARGSSDHAALYARYLIEIHLGIPVVLAAPSVVTRFHKTVRYPKCLCVAISQSGAGPDIVEVVRSLRTSGHATLAITNTPGSLLAREAEYLLDLHAGPELSVAATKTYSASLLACYQLVRALGGTLPDPSNMLPADDWCSKSANSATDNLNFITENSMLFSLARGYGFATAKETALKLMECAMLPCQAYSTADFQHGPRVLAAEDSAAILFGERIPDLEDQGCALIKAPKPPIDEHSLMPLWDIFFGQWLALLAARKRGLNADEPEGLRKVTRTL